MRKTVIFEGSSERFDWKVQEGQHVEVPKSNIRPSGETQCDFSLSFPNEKLFLRTFFTERGATFKPKHVEFHKLVEI
jgi:hypothetical protein